MSLGLTDKGLRSVVLAAIEEAATLEPHLYGDALRMALSPSRALWDPNDVRLVDAAAEGMVFVPMHMNRGTRESTRDYVHATMAACRDNLVLELHALATRVLLDERQKAIGVEFLSGENLYRASAAPDPRPDGGVRREIRVKREVILAGGVFNSPQLLMLSGIGPAATLRRHGIPVRVDRPGVGKNLQDRYEIGVVHELTRDFDVLHDMSLAAPDPEQPDPVPQSLVARPDRPLCHQRHRRRARQRSQSRTWTRRTRSSSASSGNFHGYYPGYSRELTADWRHFTWGILKAHTHNRGGEVALRSADPRDPPAIDFHYFDEGSPGHEEDSTAVVDGVLTARRIMARLGPGATREVVPGPDVERREDIARFVRDNAWGHHASCTNKMGPASDPTAVVDERFRVHEGQPACVWWMPRCSRRFQASSSSRRSSCSPRRPAT